MAPRELSVLIVDDNVDLCTSLKAMLEGAGYKVDCATNGRDALAILSRRPQGVVITDLFMPDMDGFEIIEALRRQFPATRIIVMSGGSRKGKTYLETAEMLGVEATLKKPFKPDELFATMKRLRSP